MKKPKITQEMMFFYKLYRAYREDPNKWVAAWEFVGEMHIPELNEWVLMSYKVSANGAKVYFTNPGLIVRDKVRGKSGSKYYRYRIAPDPSPAKITDKSLYDFYTKIKTRL